MNKMRVLVMLCIIFYTLTGIAQAAAPMCSKKIDSFDFVVDYSGSMMMTALDVKESKVEVAKLVLKRINSIIPALDYKSGLHTVAPASTVFAQGLWDRQGMHNSIESLQDDLPIYGRLTPMGSGLQSYEPWMASMQRKAAIILFTDGDNNRGVSVLDVVKNIYQTQRDLVVHVVSFADNQQGKDTIAQIAALNPQAFIADGITLAADDLALQQFVLDIWCEQSEEVIVLRGVNFAFDSSLLDATAQNILLEAARLIKMNPNKRILLNGWTDVIGTDAYNKTLSTKRADAVRNFLVNQGVPASRMVPIGQGKSYKYNNKTEEGRYLNRRVEMVFE